MPTHGYTLETKRSITTLGKELSQRLSLKRGPMHEFRRHYLDSFDWRLLNKGYWLQAEHHDEAILLQLFRLDDLSLVSHWQGATLPRFAQDLDPSKLAGLLTAILDVRALLPRIETVVQQQRLQLEDKRAKLTGELCIEQIRPTSAGNPMKLLLHTPIQGYAKENRALARQLGQAAELRAGAAAPLPLLLRRLGIDHDYSSKPAIDLDGAGRSDVQVKRLLAFFLDVMRRNEDGIIEDIDTEFLHDFRIAVRRSRTLLGQVPDIMPQRTLDSCGRQLAQLGRITTPLRDLDVMLLHFDDYRALLPDTMQTDLEPALSFIRRQRQAAYQQVRRHLRSQGYAGFCRRWEAFLTSPAPTNTRLANAKRPLKAVADARIWKRYKQVIKQGKAITDASPADDLHTLRKGCKKLRYLLEFFRPLYPKRRLKALIAILKQLQDHLGKYQDLHVHIEFFRQLRDAMQQAGQLPEATAGAIDRIIAALDVQQRASRHAFQARFAHFGSKAHQQLFKELFKP